MHIPVLVEKVLHYLDPRPNQNFIDATFGNGGHAKAILEKTKPNGKVLGIDWSKDAIMRGKSTFKKETENGRLKLACSNFADLSEVFKKSNFPVPNGILFDLGLSRELLENSGLGFSFQKDEPLVMRYHRAENGGLTAFEVVNKFSEEKLSEIFQKFGEEKFSRKISRAIGESRKARPIRTSFELAEIIEKAVPRRGKIHPATRVFQSLRIFVNQELENLEIALFGALEVAGREGRVLVISYHSLEDRIVKNTFRGFQDRAKAEILTKKPVTPGLKEIRENPRSRSAKLRALKKL